MSFDKSQMIKAIITTTTKIPVYAPALKIPPIISQDDKKVTEVIARTQNNFLMIFKIKK
jgi:hypothetical protein